MLMDTDREKEISLGITYPFEPLAVGECLMNENQKDVLGIQEGSTLYIEAYLNVLLNAIITDYNVVASSEGLQEASYLSDSDSS